MKFQISAIRGVYHNKAHQDGDRDYPESISVPCKPIGDDGKLTDETHWMRFATTTWDVLAEIAGPFHKVIVEGDLWTPPQYLTDEDKAAEIVNPKWVKAKRTNNRTGKTYVQGSVDVVEIISVDAGVFGDKGHFPKAADIPFTDREKTVKAPTL